MRKALLADEKVGQIAEDPKKLAFLRAIEDRENDEDLDFLDKPAEDSFRVDMDTQDDSASQPQLPPTLAHDNNSSNQPGPVSDTNPNTRPPATSRRTPATHNTNIRKPSTLAEIRDSVSFLVEAPGVLPTPDPSSEPEDNNNDNVNHNSNRAKIPLQSAPVIDRLLLKRSSTTSSTTSASSTSTASKSRLAFYAPASSSPNNTNDPTANGPTHLLSRRHTTSSTNSSSTAADKHGISTATAYATTERATAGGHDDSAAKSASNGGFKKPWGKKGGMGSSVSGFAREVERRGARVIAGVEKRRREERERRGRERRGGGGGAGLGGGIGGMLGGGFD